MIDEKLIEEWKRSTGEGALTGGTPPKEWFRVAGMILAEREEMIAAVDRFACRLCRNAPKAEGREWCVECEPCEKIPAEEALVNARRERDAMRAVLREIRDAGAKADEHGLEVDGGWLVEKVSAVIGKGA